MRRCIVPILLFALVYGFTACKKESFISSPDASLFISRDSLKFDTVFTSLGSVTQSFKIRNDNNQKLLLTRVKLAGGINSSFKTNIDGVATAELMDIEIASNDSIYVFVTVTIDPDAATLPFLVSDSILIEYNNNNRYVQLEAFGKNARFMRDETITTNTTFDNTLPYVILGSLRIDTNVTLTINPGTELYFHATAPVIVDGTINVSGTINNPVLFTGNRLDEYYRDLPGSWPGIYIRNSSINNYFRFAHLMNATEAIVVEGPASNPNPQIRIEQCQIDNAFTSGLSFYNSFADVSNSLISNCGANIIIGKGGKYIFTHNTVAAYSNIFMFRQNPVLTVSNYINTNGQVVASDLEATFTNSIFWGEGGSVMNEAEVYKEGNTLFNVTFDHCILKGQTLPAFSDFIAPLENTNPMFDSLDVQGNYYNFRITSDLAPGVDYGTPTSYPKDLDDLPRSVNNPDLGAFEKQ